jgi:hypothetical protein
MLKRRKAHPALWVTELQLSVFLEQMQFTIDNRPFQLSTGPETIKVTENLKKNIDSVK